MNKANLKKIISTGVKFSISDSEKDSNVIELIDSNNKKINISFNDVSRIIEDAEESFSGNIEDNEENKIISYDMKVVDLEGKDFDISDAIKDIKSDNGEIIAIDILAEATHNGLNANNYIYNSEDLEESVHTWMTPYKKPLLKNHNMHSEPLGRIVDAYFSKSDIADNKDTINTVFRVTDKDAMIKFLDKRYSTLSIGGSTSSVKCNICGKSILKDGIFKFCGHWKGETYNGTKATWTAGLFDYKECSVVNNPADKFAQVKKVTVIKKEDEHKNNDDDPNIKDDNSNVNDDNSKSNVDDSNKDSNINDDLNNDENKINILDDIDSALDDDNQNTDNNEDVTNDEENINDDSNVKDSNVSIEDKYNNLLVSFNEKETEIKSLNDLVADKDEKINNLESDILVIKDSALENKKKFTKVSVMYKQSLIDHIITKKLINKLIENDVVDEEKTKLLSKGTRELLELLDSITLEESNTTRKTLPTVTNPGLVDNTKGSVEEDVEDEVEEKVKNKNIKTLSDMEQEFLKD